MLSRIAIFTLTILTFAITTASAQDSTQTKSDVDPGRLVSLWGEWNFQRGNDDLQSYGFDLVGWQYRINDRLRFRLHGMTMINDFTFFRQEGHLRFSFRGVVNSLLFMVQDLIGDLHVRTAATHLLWFSNSEYRYTMSDKWYFVWGAETHYFFIRQQEAHQGILFSPKLALQFRSHTDPEKKHEYVELYGKVNLFWDFQAANKFYGITVGLCLTEKTFSAFME